VPEYVGVLDSGEFSIPDAPLVHTSHG
jgi:hypothetical protein